MKLDIYLTFRQQGDPESIQMAAEMMRSTHFQRIYAYYGGKTSELPWEGIRWVLQLLPDKPATALVALDAYFLAHMRDMTDSLIYAISDAEAVIRGRYIGVPDTQEERRQALYDLSPRQFERLIHRLYQAQGYDAELTPSQRDRGRDVIARRSQPGTREHVLIECKRYAKTIPIQYVRALLGAVSNERASAGKLVTTSSFSKEARDEMKDNHRIELIDGLSWLSCLMSTSGGLGRRVSTASPARATLGFDNAEGPFAGADAMDQRPVLRPGPGGGAGRYYSDNTPERRSPGSGHVVSLRRHAPCWRLLMLRNWAHGIEVNFKETAGSSIRARRSIAHGAGGGRKAK